MSDAEIIIFSILVNGVIFGAPVVGALGLAWWFRRRAAKEWRLRATLALAGRQGWTWVPEDKAVTHRWTGQPFDLGTVRRAINVMTGQHRGYHFTAFDYQYTVVDGNKLVNCAVWVLRLPATLPWLVVGPQGALGEDVQLESETFNRAYHVEGADDRYAMAVIHPRMMELLMSVPETYWRIDRDSIVYWEHGPIEAIRYLQRLDLLVAIANLIPSYVWKDYGLWRS